MKSKKFKNKFKKLENLDAKDRNFIKTFGELHPINDIDEDLGRKVQIVKDDEDTDEEKVGRKFNRKRNHSNKRDETEVISEEEEETLDDLVAPYQKLLNDLIVDEFTATQQAKRKSADRKKEIKKIKTQNLPVESEANDKEDDKTSDIDEANINTYSQEVLCKDNLENEELIKNDPFHIHFEINLESTTVDKLKTNLTDRAKLNSLQTKLNCPGLGDLIYSPLSDETKLTLEPHRDIRKNFIKQRILDRLNESFENFVDLTQVDDVEQQQPQNESNQNKFLLNNRDLELLNLISSYVDFYDSNVDIKSDTRTKFIYVTHALNHALKTRSRVIAHNDKMKQNRASNAEMEYRDQGLTRPKVLILVPFRKFALKVVKIIISLLMRRNEEFVSNKKRFYDSFGPVGDEDKSTDDKNGATNKTESENPVDADADKKTVRDEDFNFLFSGNTEDHFKLGLSVSKKSLKLFTEFYSSDIIIASPLGLRSIISGEGESKDYDFLSSIELLIVDNCDVLLMQNWEHLLLIFEHLHLQPKKSHDVDYSRVRNWLLEGHAKFYRQTLLFSRIPAPAINSIFNKYCLNYNGKCQIDLMSRSRYQTGTICQIGFQLGQVFHRIECDSLVDLPEVRFNFFIDKILPKFKDEMMSHTLIFIPSYFDFVKMRNYFKKNDISSMNISEYSDQKSVDRSRYLFYHGKVHFMLITERFHFYKRYRIRGINHLIFYELPHYAEYYSSYCNFLPDPKRFKNGALENFSSTVLYSKYDAQKLCAVVGEQRATHMINSEKSVHMFMTE